MTSFKYRGEYKEEKDLPTRVQEGAVQFKEPDMTKFSIIASGISLVILIVLWAVTYALSHKTINMWSPLVAFLLLVPHEFLHAIWMKGDVLMFTNFKKGMAFVVSTADLSKGRFIWMSLFPTIVFGFLPLALFIIHPAWSFFGYLATFTISMGSGDFCNVFFAATQMPKNAVTFLSGFHSFWYIPEECRI